MLIQNIFQDVISAFDKVLYGLRHDDIFPLIRMLRICVESTLVFLLIMEAFYFIASKNPAPWVLDFTEVDMGAKVRYPVRVRVLLSITLILLCIHVVESLKPLISSLIYD